MGRSGLIEPSPPWWTSLINPSTWLPLLVVLIGAYAAYFYANQLAKRKIQYDLKVQVYFELLEAIHSIIVHKDWVRILKEVHTEMPQDESIPNKGIDELEQVKKAYNSLNLVFPKLQVVCNDDVMKELVEFQGYISKSEIDSKVFAEKQLKLTQAIRKDLTSGKEFGRSPFFLSPKN
jgi:hypothetical protein